MKPRRWVMAERPTTVLCAVATGPCGGGDANGFMSLLSVGSALSIVAKAAVTAGGSETYLASTTVGALIDANFTAGSDSGGDVGTTSDGTGALSSLQGLGDLNGPYDRVTDAGIRIENYGTFNSTVINGDNLTRTLKTASASLPVTFKLWVDKELVFQGSVVTDDPFRLPTGYRSDTFEVGVSGQARIRAIHIGETPFGLRTA